MIYLNQVFTVFGHTAIITLKNWGRIQHIMIYAYYTLQILEHQEVRRRLESPVRKLMIHLQRQTRIPKMRRRRGYSR